MVVFKVLRTSGFNKVLRTSGFIKEIKTNSLSIRKLNHLNGDSQPVGRKALFHEVANQNNFT